MVTHELCESKEEANKEVLAFFFILHAKIPHNETNMTRRNDLITERMLCGRLLLLVSGLTTDTMRKQALCCD